ncbi:MAG: signal recognition particle protein [Sandaracinaceae bacterium]
MFETLSKGFRAARNRLMGVTELDEANLEPALRDVRLSLLEADVELGVVKRFLEKVKAKTVGETIQNEVETKGRKIRVGPAERFIKACQDELVAMMASEGPVISYAPRPQPTGIMMVGLQGSGKTTTSAKLARLLEGQGRKVLLVAADVQRPGAIEQLQVLGERLGIPVFAIPGGDPVDICQKGLEQARKLKRDTVIFDTAGRLAIDEPLMQQLSEIKAKTGSHNVFMVVDAMIGQDAVKTAAAFHQRLSLSGVVMTKLDGDARGGAALSIREVTGAPVKFVGTGEGLDKLEEFRPEGMASRILGFGDIVGLMKDFEGVLDEKKAEKDAVRMLKGQFTLQDFLEQLRMLQSMGPLQQIFEKLPFFADSVPEGFQVDDKELKRAEAIVSSMTKRERLDPEVFVKEPTRIGRVARGSGREDKDVVELLQRFSFMRQMMGDIGQQAGLLSKIPGLRQLAQARKLQDAVRTTGLETNPMMSTLADQLLEAAVAGGGKDGGQMAQLAQMLQRGGGMPGMPGGFPGMGGLPGGFPFPGLGGMPGMGGPPQRAALKQSEKDKKKQQRKQEKKARKKSRK